MGRPYKNLGGLLINFSAIDDTSARSPPAMRIGAGGWHSGFP